MISASIAAITKVFGSQFQLQLLHQGNVVQVLVGDLHQRQVEDIEVLSADQVEQQIQGAFEGIQVDFQGLGGDVQVFRQVDHRLAMQHGQRHFPLYRRRGAPRVRHSRAPWPR